MLFNFHNFHNSHLCVLNVLCPYIRLLRVLLIVFVLAISVTMLFNFNFNFRFRFHGSDAIVYHQFHMGQGATGRSVVYLDPFRQIAIRKPNPIHTEPPYSARAYSPDGSLYVAAQPNGSSVHLFVFSADDRVQRQLTDPMLFPTMPTASRSNTYPLWSPDGQWIAFLSSNTQAVQDIYIIRPDGTDLRLVAHDIGTPSPLRLRWIPLQPPDSMELIAFGLLGGFGLFGLFGLFGGLLRLFGLFQRIGGWWLRR